MIINFSSRVRSILKRNATEQNQIVDVTDNRTVERDYIPNDSSTPLEVKVVSIPFCPRCGSPDYISLCDDNSVLRCLSCRIPYEFDCLTGATSRKAA